MPFTKHSILIIVLVLGASRAVLAQKNNTLEFRAGAIGQLYLFRRGNPDLLHYYSRNPPPGTLASAGAGGIVSILWNTPNFSFSISPTLRYSTNKLLMSLQPVVNNKYQIGGFVADVHFSVQYNFSTTKGFLKSSSVGAGLSILNIGEPYNYDFDIRIITNVSTYNFTYHASTLQFAGIHAFFEKRFGKFSTKAMLIYSDGSWVQFSPTAMYLLHGNISVQYSIAKIKLKSKK